MQHQINQMAATKYSGDRAIQSQLTHAALTDYQHQVLSDQTALQTM